MKQRKLRGFTLTATVVERSPGYFEPSLQVVSDDGSVVHPNIWIIQNMEVSSKGFAMWLAESWLERADMIEPDGRVH